ncbi:hypothetical protein Tco_1437548 [Tanacetum coccineum]
MDEFIAHTVPTAILFAKVIQEVKNDAPTLVSDAVTDIIRPRLHKDFLHVLRDVNTDLYIALSKSIEQDKQVVPKDYCKKENLRKRTRDDQDPPDNHEGEKRRKKSRFVGQSSSRNDQTMPNASDRGRQPSSTGKTHEPEDGEIVPDNSTLTLAKKIKRCLKVDKLNLSNMEEFRRNGYELFGDRYMSKEEYDYNMDQMTITMSDNMDWALDHGLGIDSKEPLPLIGPKLNQRYPLKHFFNEDLKIVKTRNKDLKKIKYALSITKRHAAKYKCGWIEEDIRKPFRKTLVNYDMDAMREIHY